MFRALFILLLISLPVSLIGRVHYDPTLSRTARDACRDAIPLVLEQMRKTFPWFAENPAPAFSFYAGAAENTPASPFAGGYYMRARHTIYIQHVPVLIEQGRLLETMRHEAVHAALAMAGAAPLPLWLEEGCALYFSGQIIGPAPAGARRAATLAALERNLLALTKQNDEAAWLEIRASHAQARRIVSTFVERFGQGHFINFLRVLKSGTHFAQALASYYSLVPEEVDAWL
jgi:hypothetical protein